MIFSDLKTGKVILKEQMERFEGFKKEKKKHHKFKGLDYLKQLGTLVMEEELRKKEKREIERDKELELIQGLIKMNGRMMAWMEKIVLQKIKYNFFSPRQK